MPVPKANSLFVESLFRCKLSKGAQSVAKPRHTSARGAFARRAGNSRDTRPRNGRFRRGCASSDATSCSRKSSSSSTARKPARALLAYLDWLMEGLWRDHRQQDGRCVDKYAPVMLLDKIVSHQLSLWNCGEFTVAFVNAHGSIRHCQYDAYSQIMLAPWKVDCYRGCVPAIVGSLRATRLTTVKQPARSLRTRCISHDQDSFANLRCDAGMHDIDNSVGAVCR